MPEINTSFGVEVEMVSITEAEYRHLIKITERVEVLKRLIRENNFISTKDVETILDIQKLKN